MKKKPSERPGAQWRILAYSWGGKDKFELHSADYPRRSYYRKGLGHPFRATGKPYAGPSVPFSTVFDELVVKLGPGIGGDIIHLEQMSARTWYLGIGRKKLMITVKRGKAVVGDWYE